MRIVAISDFDSGFKKSVISKIKKEKPDLIIAHGDLCYGDKIRDIHWGEVRASGGHWYDYVSKKKAKDMVKKSLDQAETILKHLNSIGVPVFVVYGNHEKWDYKEESDEYYPKRFDKIVKKFKNVQSLEYSNATFDGINFVGYGALNSYMEYKKLTPAEYFKQREFLKRYRLLFSKTKPNVLVTHNCPYGTKLDKVDNPRSSMDGKHVGSKYARKLIQKFKPALCISGHMHENQGKIQLGKTLCVNSGMGSNGQYAVIDIKESKIKVALR